MAECTQSQKSSSSDPECILTEDYLKEKRCLLAMLEDGSGSEEDTNDIEENVDCEKELAGVPIEILKGTRVEPLGQVQSKMKPYAVLAGKSTFAVLDIGSLVIFSDHQTVAGIVWDVFGPVKAPFYSILVRTDIFEKLSPGDELYFCPSQMKLVSKEALLKEKGIDHDLEGPVDFSDDEEERLYRNGFEAGQVL